MKKKFLILIFVFVFVALAFLGIYFFNINKSIKKDIPVGDEEVKNDVIVCKFELENYSDEVDEFFSGEILGPIHTGKDAKEKAITFLKEVYGDKKIKNREPYHVQYDEKNKVWMVYGSLPKGYLGGIPHIIIRQDDGMVLAVWHTK